MSKGEARTGGGGAPFGIADCLGGVPRGHRDGGLGCTGPVHRGCGPPAGDERMMRVPGKAGAESGTGRGVARYDKAGRMERFVP